MICDLFFCYCGFCSFVYAFNCVLWVDLSFVCEGWMCLFWQSLEKGSPVEIGVIFLLGIVYMLLKLCCILISGYCWSHNFFLDFSSFFFSCQTQTDPTWEAVKISSNLSSVLKRSCFGSSVMTFWSFLYVCSFFCANMGSSQNFDRWIFFSPVHQFMHLSKASVSVPRMGVFILLSLGKGSLLKAMCLGLQCMRIATYLFWVADDLGYD